MPKSKEKPRRRPRRRPPPAAHDESPAAEFLTVAWTVAATMVLACNVAAVAAHLYAAAQPDVRPAALMRELLLLAGAIIGGGCLALTPIIYRVRRTPPPTGFAVFAACVSAAPLLALLLRSLR